MAKVIELDLIRISEDPFYGTFGVLKNDGIPILTSIERPWVNNFRNVSCIPALRYLVTKRWKTKTEFKYLLNDVPDRSLIQIDIANLSLELEGCIAFGKSFGYVRTKTGSGHGVRASTTAYKKLIKTLGNTDKWYLNIHNSVKL